MVGKKRQPLDAIRRDMLLFAKRWRSCFQPLSEFRTPKGWPKELPTKLVFGEGVIGIMGLRILLG